MEIKPTIKTYKVNIEAGFNYGYRAGAMCDNDDENKAEKKHPPSKKVVLITPLKGDEKQPSKKAAH